MFDVWLDVPMIGYLCRSIPNIPFCLIADAAIIEWKGGKLKVVFLEKDTSLHGGHGTRSVIKHSYNLL